MRAGMLIALMESLAMPGFQVLDDDTVVENPTKDELDALFSPAPKEPACLKSPEPAHRSNRPPPG